MKKSFSFMVFAFLFLAGSMVSLLPAFNYREKAKSIVLPQKQELKVWLPENPEFLPEQEFDNRGSSKCREIPLRDFKILFPKGGIVSFFESDYPNIVIRKSNLKGNCFITFQNIFKSDNLGKGIEVEEIKFESGKFFIYFYNAFKQRSNNCFFAAIMLFIFSIVIFAATFSEKSREKNIKK